MIVHSRVWPPEPCGAPKVNRVVDSGACGPWNARAAPFERGGSFADHGCGWRVHFRKPAFVTDPTGESATYARRSPPRRSLARVRLCTAIQAAIDRMTNP
jgi:hypothetical protein